MKGGLRMPQLDRRKALRLAEKYLSAGDLARFKQLMTSHASTTDARQKALIEVRLTMLIDQIIKMSQKRNSA